MQAQTHDGRSLRILTLIDEHSRACLALKVARRINSVGVIEALAEAMCLRDCQEFRVRAAIVDPTEVPDGTTQSTPYS